MLTLKNQSILVTGGAGFIGSHLVDRLIKEKPNKIVVVDNFFLGNINNLQNAKSNFHSLFIKKQDIRNYKKMKEIITKNNTDIIFNLAILPLPNSLKKPIWHFEHNVKMTAVLCRLAREDLFKTLVHFSSSEVYGTALTEKIDESHPLLPHTPYAASKAATDHLVYSFHKTFGLDMLIIRPFNNYGPRQNDKSYAGIIPITIKRILNNKTPIIYGDGNQTRDFIFVKDTVNATIDAYKTKNTRGKTINIANGKEISINEVVRIIAKELSWNKTLQYEKSRLGDVRKHIADIKLAKELISFKPVTDFKEGIKITIKWYKKKSQLNAKEIIRSNER
jgi:UDP-glucose 4-epimerase